MTKSLDYLSADPLAVLLRRRGMSAADAYAICEQVATRVADGADEIESIIAVHGSCPLEIREALTQPKE